MKLANPSIERHVLNTCESTVISNYGEIVCYGLGSCIGLFLYDKFQLIGAGTHIMLPDGKAANQELSSIDNLIKEMVNRGANKQTIRAKLVGGANIYKMNSFQIGQQNIHFVRQKLKENNIVIQAEEIGGQVSRTARFDIKTGILLVNSGKKFYTI